MLLTPGNATFTITEAEADSTHGINIAVVTTTTLIRALTVHFLMYLT